MYFLYFSVRALFEVPHYCEVNKEANSHELTQPTSLICCKDTGPPSIPMGEMIEQASCKLKFHSLLEKPNMQVINLE